MRRLLFVVRRLGMCYTVCNRMHERMRRTPYENTRKRLYPRSKFHADDVFATALLQILRPDIKITRGFVVPDDFDGIVYDIGFGMFDHHQEPRETRPNGIPYAAFGLLCRCSAPAL